MCHVSHHRALEPVFVAHRVLVAAPDLLTALGHDLGLLDVPVRGDAGREAGHHAAALARDAGHGVRQVSPQVCELTKITTIICRITENIVNAWVVLGCLCFYLLKSPNPNELNLFFNDCSILIPVNASDSFLSGIESVI